MTKNPELRVIERQRVVARLFQSVRRTTVELGRPLTDADASAQSMPDASPSKWHLAHTTWFFESMVLEAHVPGYRVFDERYAFLFNSYYDSVGERQPRSQRGLLTRPHLHVIYAYRNHVDAAVRLLMESPLPNQVIDLIELGCHHEQQHQELVLTDILHLFAQNPLRPAYRAVRGAARPTPTQAKTTFISFQGGLASFGHGGDDFAFDSEGPVHQRFVEPFQLATKPVTNRQWLEFVNDGGYREPRHWLSDGWAKAQSGRWSHPLYWDARDDSYWQMSLGGLTPLNFDAPVVHISLYEADALRGGQGHGFPRNSSGKLRREPFPFVEI